MVRGAPGLLSSTGNPSAVVNFIRKRPTRNLTMEAYITGPVTILGREHEINIGVNRSAQRYIQGSSYDYSTVGNFLPYPTYSRAISRCRTSPRSSRPIRSIARTPTPAARRSTGSCGSTPAMG